MQEKKSDIILQSYIIDILRALDKEPKRFLDLKKDVTNETTLSSKLTKLLEAELIEIVPIKTNRRYVNGYKLSPKGKKILNILK